MCLIPSSFTITSGNLLHISSRLSDLSPTNSVLSNDDKRLHKLSAAFFKATENGFGQSKLNNHYPSINWQNADNYHFLIIITAVDVIINNGNNAYNIEMAV
ncbi:Monocopper oxidase-like protein [Dirofilaria immitis]